MIVTLLFACIAGFFIREIVLALRRGWVRSMISRTNSRIYHRADNPREFWMSILNSALGILVGVGVVAWTVIGNFQYHTQ